MTPYFPPSRAGFALLPLVLLLMQGCSKEQAAPITAPVELAVAFPAIPFTLHAGQVPAEFQLQWNLDSATFAQVLAANNYAPTQVQDFHFTMAKLHILSPAEGNYNAFQSVALQVTSGDGGPVTVANLYPVPDGSHTLNLDLAAVNVVELMRRGGVRLVAKVHLDGPLPEVGNHQLLLSAKATMGL